MTAGRSPWTQIDWVLLDRAGAPARIPPEFDAVFRAPAVTSGLARVSLDPAPDGATARTFVVRPQELDPMGHVNNAVYADWLEEAVVGAGDPAAPRAIPRLARLEYAAPAAAGSTVRAEAWPGLGGWSLRLRDDAGRDLLRARLEPGRGTATAT